MGRIKPARVEYHLEALNTITCGPEHLPPPPLTCHRTVIRRNKGRASGPVTQFIGPFFPGTCGAHAAVNVIHSVGPHTAFQIIEVNLGHDGAPADRAFQMLQFLNGGASEHRAPNGLPISDFDGTGWTGIGTGTAAHAAVGGTSKIVVS